VNRKKNGSFWDFIGRVKNKGGSDGGYEGEVVDSGGKG